ncbi:hypothetical protein Tco_0163052 [Tanacetum coccineum]
MVIWIKNLYGKPEGVSGSGEGRSTFVELQKSFYGLKQAPRQWYKLPIEARIEQFLCYEDLGQQKQKSLAFGTFRDRDAKKLHISQEQYIEKVLRRRRLKDVIRVPYASAVGSLMHATVRYLRGTFKMGITFGNGKPMLVGYTDSDLAGNKDNMKSTSGYLMTFTGGAVSWQSRLQKYVALYTTEAEYVAATEACKELLWLKWFLQELGFKQQRYAVLCDNQNAIEDGMFELNKVHTDDNASDMLTKVIAREKLKICCSFTGMANSSS